MSTDAYIFLPDIPFINEEKSKEDIASALNKKYLEGKFDPSHIIISRKQSKYNAYAQTTQQHEKKLLDLKEVEVGNKSVLLKQCFPNHQIYINKLPQKFTKQVIRTYFGQFGEISDIQLFAGQGNYENAKQKANIVHCYIRFTKNQDAQKCLFLQKRHTIKQKEDVRVVRAYKIGQNDQTDKKIFLKISPIVQYDEQKLQKQLYAYFTKFGELRQKIRIQQLNNLSSKAIITFTSVEAGQSALQKFDLNNWLQYTLVVRPFASKQKQSFTVFVGGLRGDVNEQTLKKQLSKYGKVVTCTLNLSKKQGTLNAVVNFSDEQGFKTALADYKSNHQLVQLFAFKPYMDIHMNASLRNDYNNFKKKDRNPNGNNMVNVGFGMGGIGVGYGVPQRMNQPAQQFLGGNQFFGFNPTMNQGLNPNFIGAVPKITPQTNNFRPPL